MVKNSSFIRLVLFNVLVILTIVFIYILFFPKHSYVKERLDNELNPLIDEVYNQNMTSLTIAGESYFENHEDGKVTVSDLYGENLLVDLRDSNGDSCDSVASYVVKNDSSMTMVLECPDKKGRKIVQLQDDSNSQPDVQICMYQYEKKVPALYGEWSDWSDWSTNSVSESDVVHVETKVVKEQSGSSTVTDTKTESIDATYHSNLSCDSGYELVDKRCRKRTRVSITKASFENVCPSGYTMKNGACYNGNIKASMTVRYYCPQNSSDYEYELSGDKCYSYKITYKGVIDKSYYTCPSDYKLSGSKCLKDVSYERTVPDYKSVTYYRYQTREKGFESVDVKWSVPDDRSLLDDGYNVISKTGCE